MQISPLQSKSLPVKTAYLDGEVAIVGPDGVTSFAALQDALSKGGPADLIYFVFDLLHLDGLDLRPLPLIERKGTLRKLLGRRGKAGHIRYSDHVQGQGEAFYAHACRLGPEGIVSKLARSPYRSRRTSEWLKVKCLLRQEMVIGGWQEFDKQGWSLKSLLLGYYERGGALVFGGKAGTGFSLKLGHDLVAQLRKIEKPDHRSPRSRANTGAAQDGPTLGLWRKSPIRIGRPMGSCDIRSSSACARTNQYGR